MDEDEVLTQNGEESLSEESSDETLDSLFGGDEETEQETDSEEESPKDQDKEDKKDRDFEKAFHKEKERRKALEAKLNQPTKPEVSPEDQAGIDLLQSAIQKAIEPFVAPLREQTEKSVLSEFKQKDYVDVLESQIMKEYSTIPKSGNLAQDLETARVLAIGKNADVIVKAALEVGQSAGFKNRSFKQGQVPLKETPRKAGDSTNIIDRYVDGDLTTQELAEHSAEIEAWEIQELGVNKVYL